MCRSSIDLYNDDQGECILHWWYSDEYLELLKNIVEDNIFLWDDVADMQEELRQVAVNEKRYVYAQLHKDLKNYAQQCWSINPLDQTDEWWESQSSCIRLLCDVEEMSVDWSNVVVGQHELMIRAGKEDNLDAAIFHQKLKQYAEEVFINDDSKKITIPGQTGEE